MEKPIKVQTLDECLVIIPKSVFHTLQFDERVCDNWHLYVVDYCLSVNRLGLDVYFLPSYVYHQSTGINGNYSRGYRSTLKKLLKKHKNHFSQIYTTCGNWNDFSQLLLKFKKIQNFYSSLKNFKKGK
jgi:GT2 family glycosyltransferase